MQKQLQKPYEVQNKTDEEQLDNLIRVWKSRTI